MPIILLFITLSGFISFARVKIKLITYIKFISIYDIILYIGFFGAIFTLIELIFSSFFECHPKEFYKLLCFVNDTNTNKTYYDKIDVYFKIKLYNYQKCSLLFIIITNTLLILISTSFPPLQEDENEQ